MNLNAEAITCKATAVIDGQRVEKSFLVAAPGHEAHAERIARAYARCRQLLSVQNGVTTENVFIERLSFS